MLELREYLFSCCCVKSKWLVSPFLWGYIGSWFCGCSVACPTLNVGLHVWFCVWNAGWIYLTFPSSTLAVGSTKDVENDRCFTNIGKIIESSESRINNVDELLLDVGDNLDEEPENGEEQISQGEAADTSVGNRV